MYNTPDTLGIGKSAVIGGLTATGALRRRLLDLGLTEGCRIKALFSAPCGDPIAFLVRGSVTALRQSDCKYINLLE